MASLSALYSVICISDLVIDPETKLLVGSAVCVLYTIHLVLCLGLIAHTSLVVYKKESLRKKAWKKF